MTETNSSTPTYPTEADFPSQEDWQGWIDLWCRVDTGNLDCVPECLRPPIMHLVRPDGWLIEPNMTPSTPYQIARWFHYGSGLPMPPWIGMGVAPEVIRVMWEDAKAKIIADREAEAALLSDLYFIKSADGPIKIGLSGDVPKRLKGLQTSSPAKLELLCVVKGGGIQEGEYHHRFAAHRLHGEWFSPHPDILAEIDRLKTLEHCL